MSSARSNKELNVAKSVRDRRRRETRETTTPPGPGTSAIGGSSGAGNIGGSSSNTTTAGATSSRAAMAGTSTGGTTTSSSSYSYRPTPASAMGYSGASASATLALRAESSATQPYNVEARSSSSTTRRQTATASTPYSSFPQSIQEEGMTQQQQQQQLQQDYYSSGRTAALRASGRELLDQSLESSEAVMTALRLAQRRAEDATPAKARAAAAERPQTATGRDPHRAPHQVQPQQSQPSPSRPQQAVQQQTMSEHNPVASSTISGASATENRPPAASRNILQPKEQEPPNQRQGVASKSSAPVASAARNTSKTAPATSTTTNPRQPPPPTQDKEPPEEEEKEILTLDIMLPKLARHANFASRLAMDHPLCIRADSTVRLRMTLQHESCPRILATSTSSLSNNNDNNHNPSSGAITLQVWSAAACDGNTVVEFVVEAKQWSYPVLCYGDLIALRQKSNTKTVGSDGEPNDHQQHLNNKYLQVTAASHRIKSMVSDPSLWDVYMGPAQDVWNLWTILPHGHDGLPLRIGWAATQKPLRSCGVPVRLGAPVVLRHLKTGGLLSLGSGSLNFDHTTKQEVQPLRLVTDSLQNAGNLHPQAATMDRLQRHDLLVPTPQETIWLETATVPASLPVWQFQHQQRMFLQGTYLWNAERHFYENSGVFRNKEKETTEESVPSIRAVVDDQMKTSSGQTKALVDQLIGSFLGLESSLIHRSPLRDSEEAFVVSGCEPNLTQLASELVSISNDFVTVRRFVAAQYPGYVYGRVRQALGAAMDLCLQEYLQQVSSVHARYRQEDLGLQQLRIIMQPARDSLRILRKTAHVAEKYRGGELLNALRKLRTDSYDGETTSQNLMDILLSAASRPYLAMLHQWLESGTLDDTYKEFMVQRSSGVGEEWEDFFVIRPQHVLEGYFSTSRVRDQVLPTGRYWQAIRACQKAQSTKPDTMTDFELAYYTNPAEVAAYVQRQYREASKEVLHLLLVDYDLLGVLKLIKRYFLLDQGDFFVNFMDAAETDLYVARDKLSVGRLQHTLGLAVQLTEHKSDDAWVVSSHRSTEEKTLSASQLRCRLAKHDLIDRLDRLHRETGGIDTTNPGTPQRLIYNKNQENHRTGVDVFCIEFPHIPTPLSLILSPENMESYQLLFRSLFFAKHVERRLVSVWRDHLTLKELPTLRGAMGQTFLLRQRMLHCLQHLIYYMMFEVIEPNWSELEKKIMGWSSGELKELTVDDVLALHSKFLSRTMEACLITSRELLSSLMRLMRTCLLFADQMKLFMKSIGIDQDRQKLAVEKQKLVQQGLHNWDTSRRNNQGKKLRETLRNDYLERQRRVLEHTRRVEREVTVSTYTSMIRRHEEVFTQQLREFMNLLSQSDDLYHTQKVNLCVSLDYNGFSELTANS